MPLCRCITIPITEGDKMSDETRINVIAKDGEARVGKTFFTLNDESAATFVAESFEDFKAYVGTFKTQRVGLFYNNVGIMAYDMDTVDTEVRTAEPLASFKWQLSAIAELICSTNGRKMDRDSAERFFRRVAGYGDDKILDLLSRIKDFSVSKKLKIDRKKDGRGNFTFLVSRESAGSDDWTPPEKISFDFPLFEMIPNKVKLTMDFSFDFHADDDDDDESVKLEFLLEDLAIKENIQRQKNEVIQAIIKDLPGTRYCGGLAIQKRTDSWKYQESTI